MGRPKTQTDRRLTLVAAAESMIARRGLASVTLRDVANEAGMSSSALLYYYPGLKELLDDVQTKAVERFCTQRAASVAATCAKAESKIAIGDAMAHRHVRANVFTVQPLFIWLAIASAALTASAAVVSVLLPEPAEGIAAPPGRNRLG